MSNQNKFKTVANYSLEIEAELAKSYLHSIGIDSIIQKDDCGGMYPQMQAMQGIKLLVLAEDYEKALRGLEDLQHAEIEEIDFENED